MNPRAIPGTLTVSPQSRSRHLIIEQRPMRHEDSPSGYVEREWQEVKDGRCHAN